MKPLLVKAALVFGKVLATALAGCSSEAPGGAASACNDLVHDGSTLDVALASNPPPVPFGGVIVDGSYVLTSARLFNVPGAVVLERRIGASLEVRGNVIEHVSHVDGEVSRSTFQYTQAGTTLSLVDTCAASTASSYGFSATPAELELYSPEPGTAYTLEQIFTKR
jgi:hypothetical protein